jgi:hypothetical protein
MQDFWPFPSLWDGSSGTGSINALSGPVLPALWLTGALNHLGLDYAFSERIVWIFPSVVIAALATYVLALTFFASRLAGVVAALFVATNTYTRLVLTGGQFTVGVGAAMSPIALFLFYSALRQPTAARLVLLPVCLTIQTMYDIRTTYITVGMLALFAILHVLAQPSVRGAMRAIRRAVTQVVVAGTVGVLALAYWLLPTRVPPPGALQSTVMGSLPQGYDASGWVRALSYMQLSHAIALFHPWGYTVGGPLLPVDPLFYLLPLPFVAVLLKRRATSVELFLFTLAIVSIFLVKGSNPPAGDLYIWLFNHLPGFVMFRDPSKFYQPLALAYALLLGRAVTLCPVPRHLHLAPILRLAARGLMPAACVGVILLQALPVAANTSWGTLAPVTVPRDYVTFDQFIDRQPQFFRIMWITGASPFASASALHPSIDASYLGDPESWRRPQIHKVLQALSVKYLVVTEDRDANAARRAQVERTLQELRHAGPKMPEIRVGTMHLFLNRAYLPPVFVPSGIMGRRTAAELLHRPEATSAGARQGVLGEFSAACWTCLTLDGVSATRFEVTTHNLGHPFLLVLTQSFDPNWVAYIEPSSSAQPFWWTWLHQPVPAQRHLTVNGFSNAWWINVPGSHRIVVEFWPQRFTDIGFIVTFLTISTCMVLTVIARAKRCLAVSLRVPKTRLGALAGLADGTFRTGSSARHDR